MSQVWRDSAIYWTNNLPHSQAITDKLLKSIIIHCRHCFQTASSQNVGTSSNAELTGLKSDLQGMMRVVKAVQLRIAELERSAGSASPDTTGNRPFEMKCFILVESTYMIACFLIKN